MTLIEALKTNKPIRLSNKSFSYYNSWTMNTTYIMSETWLDPEWFLSIVNLSKEDILSEEWEIKKA